MKLRKTAEWLSSSIVNGKADGTRGCNWQDAWNLAFQISKEREIKQEEG